MPLESLTKFKLEGFFFIKYLGVERFRDSKGQGPEATEPAQSKACRVPHFIHVEIEAVYADIWAFRIEDITSVYEERRAELPIVFNKGQREDDFRGEFQQQVATKWLTIKPVIAAGIKNNGVTVLIQRRCASRAKR